MLKLCLIEVDRLENPCSRKAENWMYVVASVDSNLKGSKESVQHEKWSLSCLLSHSEFLENLVKCKVDFMLGNYGLWTSKCTLKGKWWNLMHTSLVHVEN